MHSKGTSNDLELQRNKWKQCTSKACTLKVFKTIWNCREINENNVSKACILVVFKTIWNCRENMKTMSLNHAF